MITKDKNIDYIKSNNIEVGKYIWLYFSFVLNLSFSLCLSLTMIAEDKSNKYDNSIPSSR
jgi:hypothetical protein